VNEPLDDLAAEPRAAELLALASIVEPASSSASLRRRVLAAAFTSRHPGRPAAHVDDIGSVEALRRTIVSFGSLVDSLTDNDGARITIEGWTVAGLLGHLTGVDEYFGCVLGWWQSDIARDEVDHLAMTLPTVAAATDSGLQRARDEWRETSGRVLGRLSALEGRLDQRVSFHGFDFSINSVLIARTFEMWTHLEDICRAIGATPDPLDAERLRLMTNAAVGALPLGMMLSGRLPMGRSVRIVLTGVGGGSWVQPLEIGLPPDHGISPSATLLTDAVAFCRVAAKRLDARELEFRATGDAGLVDDVLVAAAVFAA